MMTEMYISIFVLAFALVLVCWAFWPERCCCFEFMGDNENCPKHGASIRRHHPPTRPPEE